MYESHAVLIAQILADSASLHGTAATFTVERSPSGRWTARVARDNWSHVAVGPTIAHAIEDLAALVAAELATALGELEGADDDGDERLLEAERDTLPGMPVSARVA